jgi:hypothetical protein
MGQQPRESQQPREGYGVAPKATEDDVEGHGMQPREGYGVAPKATEDDVEGHSMLPMDVGSARHLASARESEIRRQLSRHDMESEARRPHNKQTK